MSKWYTLGLSSLFWAVLIGSVSVFAVWATSVLYTLPAYHGVLQRSVGAPDLHYGDYVRVTSGFWTGLEGVVVGYDNIGGDMRVRLEVPRPWWHRYGPYEDVKTAPIPSADLELLFRRKQKEEENTPC